MVKGWETGLKATYSKSKQAIMEYGEK